MMKRHKFTSQLSLFTSNLPLIIFLFLFFISNFDIFCQVKTNNIPNFSSPIKIPLALSGNFAELRQNHFHSGIDLRVRNPKDRNVYCPFEGEVSRIKIQAFGGGKNLYITHPNGYTTVYMHLQNYSPKIEQFVREYQYANQKYEFDIPVNKGRLKINKDEIIGVAGNTGSSAGVHLHFEVRDTKTENVINPQSVGFNVKDIISPEIYSIIVCPEGDFSRVEGVNSKKIYKTIGKNKNIKQNDTIKVTNKVYLGIMAYDKSEGSTQRNGVYSYELKVDKEVFWKFKIDEFSFNESRYINACIDYEQYLKNKERYLITKHLPGNALPYFNTSHQNGIIQMENGQVREIEYILQDYSGNKTNFTFYLQSSIGSFVEFSNTDTYSKTIYDLYWNKDNQFNYEDISIRIPKNALYDNTRVYFTKDTDVKTKISTYQILSDSPLHLDMNLSISIPEFLLENEKLKHKLVVAQQVGKSLNYVGNKIIKDKIVAGTKSFGIFTLALDTIEPKISPINFNASKLKPNQKILKVRISDNLSGIKSYNAYINNKWVLMEYDGKTATLIYTIDPKELNQPSNSLKIIVKDRVGNVGERVFTLLK